MARNSLAPRSGPRLPRATVRLPFDLAPALSVLGLLLIGAVSIGLLNGNLPTLPGSGGQGGGPQGPVRTPTPSNVVVTDPRADVPGSILYVKAGNIWVQTGETARQLTTGGNDATPTWSADGQWIYFVRSTKADGRWPSGGEVRTYHLTIPSLTRMHPDGSGVESLVSGQFKQGSYSWAYFLREPSISPDGTQAAVITDGPDPTRSDIVMKLVDLSSGTLTSLGLGESRGLGHQDPAWSPDGRSILYVREAREGTRGTPSIYRYSLTTRKSSALTGAGYMQPAWSRDGRYVAATKTSTLGTDVVVLDAATGAELLRLTNDGQSFGPVWSPKGDALAFFRVDHGVVDLYLAPLTGSAPSWTIGTPLALTVSAGLDATSRASWFIPADQLPSQPTPVPTSGSSAAAASSAPTTP